MKCEEKDNRLEDMSIEDFKRIIREERCFICGAAKKEKGIKDERARTFNDEHVIPRWVVRRCRLSNEKAVLSDGSRVPYIKYMIPCCEECNERLGRAMEKSVSRLFFEGNDELLREPRRKKTDLMLLRWLSLIFIKVHLRDGSLMKVLDDDTYDWRGLYRIWSTARSILTEETTEDELPGGLIILECEDTVGHHFDYNDDLSNKTIIVKIGNICLIGVLNDKSKETCLLKNTLKNFEELVIDSPKKDILSHINYIRVNLDN